MKLSPMSRNYWHRWWFNGLHDLEEEQWRTLRSDAEIFLALTITAFPQQDP